GRAPPAGGSQGRALGPLLRAGAGLVSPEQRERLLIQLDAVIDECWAAGEIDFVRQLDPPRAALGDAVRGGRLREALGLPCSPEAVTARAARQLGAEGLL